LGSSSVIVSENRSIARASMSLPSIPAHDRNGSSYIIVAEIPETEELIYGMMRHRPNRLDGNLFDGEERA
jgi:hypothetical protein